MGQEDQKLTLIELEASLDGVHETVFQNNQRRAIAQSSRKVDHTVL